MTATSNIGTCQTCGKQLYRTRKDARKAARTLSRKGMNAYRCGDYWHLGHLPSVISRGRGDRDAVRGA